MARLLRPQFARKKIFRQRRFYIHWNKTIRPSFFFEQSQRPLAYLVLRGNCIVNLGSPIVFKKIRRWKIIKQNERYKPRLNSGQIQRKISWIFQDGNFKRSEHGDHIIQSIFKKSDWITLKPLEDGATNVQYPQKTDPKIFEYDRGHNSWLWNQFDGNLSALTSLGWADFHRAKQVNNPNLYLGVKR